MKKLVMATLIILTALAGISEASDVAFKPALVGDVLYDIGEGQIVPVVSMQIVSAYDALLEARAMVVGNPDDLARFSKVGVGIGVNLVKLTERLGQTWTAKAVNPSVGVAPIYDFSTKKVGVGVYISVIRIEF